MSREMLTSALNLQISKRLVLAVYEDHRGQRNIVMSEQKYTALLRSFIVHFLVCGSHSLILCFKHWHLCAPGMGLEVRAESPAATVKGILTVQEFGSSCAKSFLPGGVCFQAVDSVRANCSKWFVVSCAALLS